MWSIIGGVVQVIAGWLGWQSKRQERFNAPDMVQNKQAATDLTEKEKIESDVAKNDLDAERKDMAE